MKSISLTEEEFYEIVENYKMSSDESYKIHTAYLIYDKLKEAYPEEFEERE